MKSETINTIFNDLKENQSLIHCITNPISVHQCANGILAVGSKPIMAEHPKEVGEITNHAQALLLNLGSITDVRMESMLISASVADSKAIPIVLDAVGVGCSTLRRQFAHTIINRHPVAVVKGNYSEIEALYNQDYTSCGVDSDPKLYRHKVQESAVRLAKKWNCVIVASGPCDIVTEGQHLMIIKNGHPQLASVTGTGCLLGALIAACCTVANPLEGAVAACAMLGVCGEMSATKQGNGQFLLRLMDFLSTATEIDMCAHIRMEEKSIERV